MVSIIVPIYGVEKYIERCARSLFSQTYSNCEFIFVNDCTKDNSIKILNKVICEYSYLGDRIRLINHAKNRGIGSARKTGLEAAKGYFFLMVDSDDYVANNYVEFFFEVLRNNDADIVIQGWETAGDAFKSINPSVYLKQLLMRRASPSVWGKIFKKDVVLNSGLNFVDGINHAEDFSFLCRYVSVSSRIYGIKEMLYHYSVDNQNSYTNNYTEQSILSTISSHRSVREFLLSIDSSYKDILNLSALDFYKSALDRKLIDSKQLDILYSAYFSELDLSFLQKMTLFGLQEFPLMLSKILIALQYKFLKKLRNGAKR